MSSNKTYPCLYCGKRYNRDKMPTHIESKHLSELPEGFTPLQATYHIVNNRPLSWHRACRVCGMPTAWDENKGRYNMLCDKKSCHDTWAKKMKDEMGTAMGSNRPTSTPEGLQKMLAGRHISGSYKFKDGGERTYTGTYEKKTLEFFDQVLECKSEDVQTPGPVLQYEFEGKMRYYISDVYYIPYNLVIEVKDGGDRPNTNPAWEDSRQKKIAKEKYMINNTDYNYLRLTDNDFSQLMAVFADLKMHLLDNDSSRVIHVNEDATTIGAIPMNGGTKDGVVIVNYMQNNVFANEPDFAIANDVKLTKLIRRDWDKLKVESTEFLEDCKYTTYWVKCDRQKVMDTLYENLNNDISKNFIYETVFGHPMYTKDQILFEQNCSEYKDYYNSLYESQQAFMKYILNDKEEDNGRS